MPRTAAIALLALTSIVIAGDTEKPEAKQDAISVRPWRAMTLQIAQNYRDDLILVSVLPAFAHAMCRYVPPTEVFDSQNHELNNSTLRKQYMLYIAQSDQPPGWMTDIPEDVGQIVVKEAWHTSSVPHPKELPPAFAKEHAPPLRAESGETVYETGPFYGLFIMYRVDPETPDTDDGWVYATVAPNNDESDPQAWTVVETGAIESCIKCHSDVPGGGRIFGHGIE